MLPGEIGDEEVEILARDAAEVKYRHHPLGLVLSSSLDVLLLDWKKKKKKINK